MRRILFVDDEPTVLQGLRDRLRGKRRKWDMAFAVGGKAAIRELDEKPFDVVVTDLHMPDMDGAEVLTHVQQRHPTVIRILLSGHANSDATLNAMFVAHQFMVKPFDTERLDNVVERACELQSSMGNDCVREVVGRIDTLPSAPGIYCTLTNALANPNVGTHEVAGILQRDVALCTKLLQLVNSAFFRTTREITSIEAAVAHLGFETIRTLVLTVEVFQTTDSRVSGQTIESLQRHALLTANIAARLPENMHVAQPAFTAGMLHDVGKLVLASELPGHIGMVLDEARADERPLHEVEQERYGVTHAEVGAYLLGLWGLPYPIVEAVARHHNPTEVPQREFDALAAVYVANCLAHEQGDDASWEGVAPVLRVDYLESLGVAHQLSAWREMAASLAETRL